MTAKTRVRTTARVADDIHDLIEPTAEESWVWKAAAIPGGRRRHNDPVLIYARFDGHLYCIEVERLDEEGDPL